MSGPAYCRKACGWADKKQRREARKAHVRVERYSRSAIFERDGWRCHICKREVDRTQKVPHPRAPTIDHIKPIVLFGPDAEENVKTACFSCNCRKGARVLDPALVAAISAMPMPAPRTRPEPTRIPSAEVRKGVDASQGHRMDEPIGFRISTLIREIRQAQGTTRDELAALARAAGAPESFTTAALRNLEIGRRSTTVDEVVWLATALRVPARQLLAEHALLFGAEDKPDLDCGPVEAATRAAVQELADLDGRQLALAQGAYALAKKLDEDAGMATAAVSKELRATLKDIWDAVPDDGDEDEDDLGPS